MSLLEKTVFKVDPLLRFKERPLIGETSFIWTMTAFILAACGGGGGGGAPVTSGGPSDIVEPKDTVGPDDTDEPDGPEEPPEEPEVPEEPEAPEEPIYATEPNNYFYGTENEDMFAYDPDHEGANYIKSSASVKVDLNGPADVDGYTTGHSGGFAEGDKTKEIHHIYGTEFKDILMGDGHPNWIYGHEGDDQLFGYGGNDSLIGYRGDDRLEGGADADSLDGGRGLDWAIYKTSPEAVTVDLGAKDSSFYVRPSGGHATGDRLIRIENIVGSDYDDTLIGDAGSNRLAGVAGADIIDGGEGSDWVDYSASGNAVMVDLSAIKDSEGYIRPTGGHAAGDRVKNIENIIGSINADELIGDNGDNQIRGGDHFDTVTGNGGKDIFIINP